MNPFANYDFGGEGVNLVKDPLQLADAEATQLQNAELVPDQSKGGEGSLSKRGGLAALNASPLSGSVLGMLGLNLKTTFVRTLYAARGTVTANTFRTTTDGTTWVNSAGPLAAGDLDKFTDANGTRDSRRMTAFRNVLLYGGNAYTKGTNNPPIAVWNGTEALTVGEVTVGPSATALTPAYAITDWLVAAGFIYLAVHDPGGSAPALAGRVMSISLETGVLAQVCAPFGNGAGEQGGGAPSALAWYQGQLWVGLQGNTTTDAIGTIVRCRPSLDTAWTADVSTLSGFPSSLCVYRGDLYAGVQSSVSSQCKVYKRTATTKAWAASFTSSAGTSGTAHVAALTVYNDELYGVEYFSGGTDVVHIKKWDGSSWTTDRDVDNLDSLQDPPQLPGSMAILGSDLYLVMRSTTATATDGFVLRKTSGVWSKVDTNNYGGQVAVLVERT